MNIYFVYLNGIKTFLMFRDKVYSIHMAAVKKKIPTSNMIFHKETLGFAFLNVQRHG